MPCAGQRRRPPVGVRLPRQYLRHINAELWLAQQGGTHTWDNPASFVPDTTWAISAPWAP